MTGQDPAGDSRHGSDATGLDTALLDQMPEAVAVCSLDGACLHVNPALERLLGRPGQDLLGRVLWALHPEWTERSFQDRFQQVARTGEPAEFENHVAPVERWFVLRLLRSHARVVLFCREITAEKKQEATLRALYDEMRRAQRHAAFLAQASEVLASSLEHDLILQRLAHLAVPVLADACSVDLPMPDGQVRRAAMAYAKPELQVVGEAFQTRFPVRTEDPAGIGKVLRVGLTEFVPDFAAVLASSQGGDLEYRRAVESLGITAYIIVPLISRGRVLGALTLLNSESRRRYTEADVRLAEDLARRAATSLDNGRLYTEAQEAVRARDSFLSVASHELNTPLTSLMLNIHALRRDMEPRAGSAPASVDALTGKVVAVQRQVSRLSSLVRELLDVSRITAGRLVLEREDLDLAALTREVVPRFFEDGVRAGCEIHLDAQGPVLGHWDRLRLEQVLQNLLSNAIKYGRGSPIEVRVGADDTQAWLSVKDHGMGIPPEGRARLFQRFERLASERHYGGLGLGLWIVKQIVDAMDGRIRVESTPGQGSTFTVELPRPPG
ncbi:Sensory box histidine kinase [Myxococcus hansupus]|uniref:histidine kinase n=1 Tax=Pseudomyxococcus hansupus TaxID=1297742 RepID=A0A0H4WME3_9BACT|nr:PAS domain-containing sensor histidine kinase [Myxococcus hansupus]AKQ64556.1 Sensory box histidine kinase [Myxococcus hansupus]